MRFNSAVCDSWYNKVCGDVIYKSKKCSLMQWQHSGGTKSSGDCYVSVCSIILGELPK